MFQFGWPRPNGKSNAGIDIEMGDVDKVCPTGLMLSLTDYVTRRFLVAFTVNG
jgi:hypothetical protein